MRTKTVSLLFMTICLAISTILILGTAFRNRFSLRIYGLNGWSSRAKTLENFSLTELFLTMFAERIEPLCLFCPVKLY